MSYEKYTWQTGEVITADKLNHMEDGIAAANAAPIKSITIENTTENLVVIYECLNDEGKYVEPVGDDIQDDDYIVVSAGDTATVYYVEPETGSGWKMSVGAADPIALQTDATGITEDGGALIITPEAPDGATVTVSEVGD